MKKTLYLLLSLILVTATSNVFAQDKATVIAETMVDSYQIGIGDILEIATWKEPDFTREAVLVRTDGKISFPLLLSHSAMNSIDNMATKQKQLKHKRRYCRHPGCSSIVKSQGLCQRHGAKPRLCKVQGCKKQAQGNFVSVDPMSITSTPFPLSHTLFN